ncbi:hypothetical protein GQ43DRAFT_438032 [Delitschia confertaspora ATCC 74209]|uniref:UBC core domain-containing protein n=1 Tax=Delitschia confertaspora ATCC 74209 TaxID=1513339 RepID=A0A9P4MV45_9PLEO|nr:hypothetical protein GQ43DRAFT_438032 [Delitschia confertaspora ATCC 74209]
MATSTVHFCCEDTVSLKDDKHMVGIIDRSFGDVDSHEPKPQREYPDDIQRHKDIPKEQFNKFMRTGVPPRGTVLVAWQTGVKTELIPEERLELLDRALYVGDVVKKNARDPMSGTVVGTKTVVSLLPRSTFQCGRSIFPMHEVDNYAIRGVLAEELINVHEYQEGALVIYGDWMGRIEEVYDEITVKLSNNSVVVVEDPMDLEPDDHVVERISVGDWVTTKKGNLRRGRWQYGAFDPNVKPHGVVVETRPFELDVHWLTRRPTLPVAAADLMEPPSTLYRDDFESDRFFIYDASGSDASTLPQEANGQGPSYHVAEVSVGDRVRFKDLDGAAVKYDGTSRLPNGVSRGTLCKTPRTETLGYDMNVFTVMETHSEVTVQWQDLSITTQPSTSLIPDPNVEDDDEVWPGEIVCTKENTSETVDPLWATKPAKIGVVQEVKPRDRIASVCWFSSHNIRFFEEHILPGRDLGDISETTEEVSLYDIRSTPSLTRRRGDFVLIDSDDSPVATDQGSYWFGKIVRPQSPYWFGEVIDLGLDGKVTVRLGAIKPVVDIRVPISHVTLVYSSDMDSQFDFMPTLEGESVDDDSDAYDSDFDAEEFEEMWAEYEDGDAEPLEDDNEGGWTTEDETTDDDDESMPDLEEPERAMDTSKTTPEVLSDSEHRKPPETSTPVQPFQPTTEIHAPAEVPTASVEDGPLAPFLILDTPPPADHHYLDTPTPASSTLMKRIAKEHKILRSSLPPQIYVRTWESRLDLLRVLIIGPLETPYEYAPFVIDFHLAPPFPSSPPQAFFHSWTNGNGPVNPNLYEDGKICLSLLGTWHADEKGESWSEKRSTVLQVLVSVLGLVLCREPYYNEAGYDGLRGGAETKIASGLYSERAYFRAKGFIVHALEKGVEPFGEVLRHLYTEKSPGAPHLLEKAISKAKDIIERSEEAAQEAERDGLSMISLGAVVMLKRQVERLEALCGEEDTSGDQVMSG